MYMFLLFPLLCARERFETFCVAGDHVTENGDSDVQESVEKKGMIF